MSVKRQATTELNHENWDKDDPAEHEEMGTYKIAPKEVLEKRVIRTAKRRSQQYSGDEAKKGVFSGFGGFNKAQPTSFDFLANLTNGSKTNGSPVSKSENAVPSSVFKNTNSFGSNPSASLFNIPVTSTATTKLNSVFGSSTTQTSSIYTASSSSTGTTTTNLFTASKADFATGNFPFMKSPLSSTTEVNQSTTDSNVSLTSSTIFGTSSKKSLFSTPTANSAELKIQPVSTTTSSALLATSLKESESKVDEKDVDSKKLAYYGKLKGLNISVSNWIKKHVDETPLCILTPIFNDYAKYLKEIQDEYNEEEEKVKENNEKVSSIITKSSESLVDLPTPAKQTSTSLFSGSPFAKTSTTHTEDKPFSFGINNSTVNTTASSVPKPTFSFGINKPSNENELTVTKPTFSFGINKSSNENELPVAKPNFTFGINKSSSENESPVARTNFSFGINKSSEKESPDSKPNFSFGINKSSIENNSPVTKPNFSFGINKSSEKDSPVTKPNFSFETNKSSNENDSPITKPNFSFGINKCSNENDSPVTKTNISFGTNKSVSDSNDKAPGPFAFASNTSGSNPGALFSFGGSQKFSFSPGTQNPVPANEQNNEKEDDDPPKVEFTPVVEENSVFDKRCKVFVKNQGNFADKGVGTLYIKKIENSAKHQLIVRANNNLGTVLLNLILGSTIPTQRMGKNNVMLVCIPTPDAKPPPTSVLIRVKTAEEADELLETLNKYKA